MVEVTDLLHVRSQASRPERSHVLLIVKGIERVYHKRIGEGTARTTFVADRASSGAQDLVFIGRKSSSSSDTHQIRSCRSLIGLLRLTNMEEESSLPRDHFPLPC